LRNLKREGASIRAEKEEEVESLRRKKLVAGQAGKDKQDPNQQCSGGKRYKNGEKVQVRRMDQGGGGEETVSFTNTKKEKGNREEPPAFG